MAGTLNWYIKLVKMMKRKNEIENPQKTKREKMTQAVNTETESNGAVGVGGNHLAWDIIISRLDYQDQMKMSQQNKRLAEVVLMNAESDLRKFRCHIQENKYM